MSIRLPAPVEAAIRESGVACEALAGSQYPPASGAMAVRAVLLRDAEGNLLALLGADQLLDLAALGRFTGRDLEALPRDSAAFLRLTGGADEPAGVPGALGLPTVVDRGLTGQRELLLPSGAAGVWLRCDESAFRVLLGQAGAASGSFAIQPDSREGSESGGSDSPGTGFTARRLNRRIEDTTDFPPMPEVAQRILQLGADPEAGVNELVKVVEMDPALAAQVVSWAASPYYAAPGGIASVRDAVFRVLGFDVVMNLALGLALGKAIRLPREGRHGYRQYWLRSVRCAALCEALCRAMPADTRPVTGQAFLTGLLHDFGFLLMAELFKPQFQHVCRYLDANEAIGHAPVERHVLGLTREEIAAWLLQAWRLPAAICAAIRHREQPSFAGEHATLATLLQLATRLLEEPRAQAIAGIPEALIDRSGLARGELEAVAEQVLGADEALQALARAIAA